MISVDSLYIRAKIIYMGAKSLIILAAVAFLLCFSQAFAKHAAAQEYPGYQDTYVNDFAGIFTGEQVSHMREILALVEDNTTAEVVVVTVDTVSPLEPAQYATELFARWGVGKKGEDNGLLILYAKEEGKIWVTTGYGMEGLLPDSRIGRMLDDYYVPARDAGNVTVGIVRFTDEVAALIMENPEWGGAGFLEENIPPWLYLIIVPLFGLFMLSPLAFILAFFGLIVVIARRFGPKCEKDGTRMKFTGYEGDYAVFECPLCHAKKKKKRVRNYGAAAGGFAAGGFRGGGGGFGGGGFGGGFGGGGGAGR
jgi:uncharacterized protein